MYKIPKIAYFYWGGTVLPYLRFISMVSFKKMNPDWKVICFTPTKLVTSQSWRAVENKQQFQTVDYMSSLESSGVIVSPFDMQSIGFSNDLSEVLKSDVLRLYLLHTAGGVWSDNDIMFFRPLGHVLKPTDCCAYFCFRRGGPTQQNSPKNGPLYHSVGFLAGAPGNKYFGKLWESVNKTLDPLQYQSIGCPYYKTVYNEFNMSSSDVFNLDINTVYPTRAAYVIFTHSAQRFMFEVVRCQQCIGIHWYAGAPINGQFQNKITEDTYKYFDNIVCWLIDKVNRGVSV